MEPHEIDKLEHGDDKVGSGSEHRSRRRHFTSYAYAGLALLAALSSLPLDIINLKVKELIPYIVGAALGIIVLFIVVQYLVQRLQAGYMPKQSAEIEQLQERVRAAYMLALEKSSINPGRRAA